MEEKYTTQETNINSKQYAIREWKLYCSHKMNIGYL